MTMEKRKKDHEDWQKIPELSKSGYLLIKEKRYREAEQEFLKILDLDKKNIYALVGMGDVNRGRKDFEKAIDYYTQSRVVDPLNKFALIGLADTFRGLNRFDEAIKIWEEYLSNDEHEFDIAILTRLGDTLRKTGKTKMAVEIYMKAFGIDPKNPYVLSGLGLLHFEKGEYEKSLSFWLTLLVIEPDDVKVLTNTGNCYRKLKQYTEAMKYFYKAQKTEENNFYALYGIADCYRGLKEYQKAAEYWHKIIKFDPFNKKILTRLGDSYRNLGNAETARFYYQKAIEKDFDYYAILGLSILDKMQKNYAAAIQNLTQLEKVSGMNPNIALLLSECYMEINDKENGIKVLSNALKQGLGSRDIKERLKHINQQ